LVPECRAELAQIDFHFHDLRHEAGCRWLEAGIPLHHIQETLGHASVAQTSTYLHASEFGLKESMEKFDAARIGKRLASEPPAPPPSPDVPATSEADKGRVH